jgi:predicted small secreted protein
VLIFLTVNVIHVMPNSAANETVDGVGVENIQSLGIAIPDALA